jgi:hypothetical protein
MAVETQEAIPFQSSNTGCNIKMFLVGIGSDWEGKGVVSLVMRQ